ncbi:Bug family tripartite tricarboxylate transporter substrate binding protein [Roseomonas populi]|uniref:Tripartite tricarboxylate transporter substrate binding protein n=1 Tax=Roseomonas populi TaxID=3121582 RepID=A0ABT1X6X9_9PROT|nr:tripartite tricarboxylate transporter substrate binding protein [Roseomonas pecuniae]MCR0983865.1 tripartite tricarboxylate transporter substrate binding protein [Roseomonas pecuniae]
MTLSRRPLMAALLGAAPLAVPALAQAPAARDDTSRPITLVVAWPPGGGTDFVARLLAEQMARELGQPVVVENRAGASGTIGHAVVARARPDGSTILLGVNSTYAMARHLFPGRGYDDERDFVPIGRLATIAAYLCVHRDSPIRSVTDLIAAAKAAPGQMTYASPGAGSSGHLAPELFFKMAGIQVETVTYRGGAPMVQAMLSKEVNMAFLDVVTALPYVRSGELRALGIGSRNRLDLTPDVPTVAEAGVPGFECNSDYALLAPARTPDAAIRRLHAAAVAALQAPAVRDRLTANGYVLEPGTPEEWPAYLRAEANKWGDVIRSRGITLE